VATPLELLFDLTFVIAFGVAASQLAHMLASGHVGAGLAGFVFATFSVCWAWINFSWFASAYDTDDWVYRLTTMLQMVGVLVLALGIPQVFSSIAEGRHVDNRVVTAAPAAVVASFESHGHRRTAYALAKSTGSA
jgi:low temperature requirement protein LtrA